MESQPPVFSGSNRCSRSISTPGDHSHGDGLDRSDEVPAISGSAPNSYFKVKVLFHSGKKRSSSSLNIQDRLRSLEERISELAKSKLEHRHLLQAGNTIPPGLVAPHLG